MTAHSGVWHRRAPAAICGKAASLIARIAEFRAPNVFNPWAESDPLDAFPNEQAARRERLAAHFSEWPQFLLIGEAPGYQGCHFSGVAFTNEKLILEGAVPRVQSTGRITSREKPWCEPSATIVWRTLREFGLAEHVVLWNAFAWHPYKSGEPLSNRAPSPAELRAGLPVLRAVLDHFCGAPVVAIGRVAERALRALDVTVHAAVRHPSMGGAAEFRRGLAAFTGAVPPLSLDCYH